MIVRRGVSYLHQSDVTFTDHPPCLFTLSISHATPLTVERSKSQNSIDDSSVYFFYKPTRTTVPYRANQIQSQTKCFINIQQH